MEFLCSCQLLGCLGVICVPHSHTGFLGIMVNSFFCQLQDLVVLPLPPRGLPPSTAVHPTAAGAPPLPSLECVRPLPARVPTTSCPGPHVPTLLTRPIASCPTRALVTSEQQVRNSFPSASAEIFELPSCCFGHHGCVLTILPLTTAGLPHVKLQLLPHVSLQLSGCWPPRPTAAMALSATYPATAAVFEHGRDVL